jgi:hypothetical protein
MVPNKPITVNVKQFLEDRMGNKSYVDPTMTTVKPMSKVDMEAMRKKWEMREKTRALEEKLDYSYIDCPECGQQQRPYKLDYVCFQCRDTMDA